jgi:hypothetical protein
MLQLPGMQTWLIYWLLGHELSAKEDIPKKKRSHMVLSIYETRAQLIAQNW